MAKSTRGRRYAPPLWVRIVRLYWRAVGVVMLCVALGLAAMAVGRRAMDWSSHERFEARQAEMEAEVERLLDRQDEELLQLELQISEVEAGIQEQ